MGRLRGAALIGRPLNLSIPVSLTEGEGACFEAELYFGETRAEKPALQWEPGGDAQGHVRLVTRQAVDEPMVTVYLTAGCHNRVTRRYVLLSEQPPDAEPAPRASAVPRGAPAVAVAAAPTPAVRLAPRPTEALAPAPAAPAKSRPPAARKGEDRPAAAPVRPRLTLESPDTEPDTRLRLETGLRAEPAADAAARQQAASLWRALNTTPEQAVREADRLRALESDVAALKDSSRQTAAALTLMVGQLEKARGERNQVALVLLLFVGLAGLGGAAAAAWWWHRRRTGEAPPWHTPAAAPAAPASGRVAVEPDSPLPEPAVAMPRSTASFAEPDGAGASAPASPSTEGPGGCAALEPAAPPPADPPDTMGRLEELSSASFAPGMGSARIVGVEELMGIEDKAAFFVSIGQHDQAMAVLESHVHDEVETSALPWLDLLELYHTFDRREDYERLRREFIAQFNAEVPGFEDFAAPSGGLQEYPRALSRIVSLWPTPRVLEVIEESIFRRPDAPGAEAFSLEAYRELLLLYHLAREVVPRQETPIPFRTTDFAVTTLEPLSAGMRGADGSVSQAAALDDLDRPVLALADLPSLELVDLPASDLAIPPSQIPPASPRLGLDVDLADIEVQAHSQTVLAPDLEFHLEWDSDVLAVPDAARARA